MELQRTALEETKAVFPSLRERIRAALEKLENELVSTFSLLCNELHTDIL